MAMDARAADVDDGGLTEAFWLARFGFVGVLVQAIEERHVLELNAIEGMSEWGIARQEADAEAARCDALDAVADVLDGMHECGQAVGFLETASDAIYDVEFVDRPLYESEYGRACPWCGGLDPTGHYWPRQTRGRTMGHAADCRRQAALRR